ncbi:hypothetical protein IV02_01220 [Pseudomonas syringae]|uniref:Uncharacterized protein n=1 Tax=Pseudomonas syringae TaxID=317 RepID=A0A085VKF1_PSESX|nr:hypothetical protein IV02_01220 [Pseudomonas syringae]
MRQVGNGNLPALRVACTHGFVSWQAHLISLAQPSIARIFSDYLIGARQGLTYHLIRLFGLAVIHSRRASGHARHRDSDEVGVTLQVENLCYRYMAFDKFPVNHRGMTGRQARSDAEALFDFAHVGLDMLAHAEAINFKILYSVLAAAAVRIAVNIDDFSSLCRSVHE